MKPRIYVQIASYRDPECQWTVKDLFEKAKYPERIFVGICWQFDPEEDKDCFEIPSPYPKQMRITECHWKDTRGVCWARNKTQQLWQGEEYTLQIDAHTRFPQNWDEMMINELAHCPGKKPLLTCYTAPYKLPNEIKIDAPPSILRAKPFSEKGVLRFRSFYLNNPPDKPIPSAFISCHMFFARGEVFKDVPADPHMYFDQEEISLSLRLFTHGYNIYHPSKVLCYHLYHRETSAKRYNSPWRDGDKWKAMDELGHKRFEHLSGYKTHTDPEVLKDLDKFGLGKERTLEQYQEYSGVDFKNRTLADRATGGREFPELG